MTDTKNPSWDGAAVVRDITDGLWWRGKDGLYRVEGNFLKPRSAADLERLYGPCKPATLHPVTTPEPNTVTWRQGEDDGPIREAWKPGRKARVVTSAGGTTHTRGGVIEDNEMFGDLMLPPPAGTKHVSIYAKPADAGLRGACGGVRRDAEAIYRIGSWPTGIGGRTSIYRTRAALVGSPSGIVSRSGGHPHAKALDVLEELIEGCPPGVIADPFAGSGSTLVAAKALGRKAIGVELEERYCEIAARRLAQDVLDFGSAS